MNFLEHDVTGALGKIEDLEKQIDLFQMEIKQLSHDK